MAGKSDSATGVDHIVICGSGLAAQMTAAALGAQLPAGIDVTLVETAAEADGDIFYGTVASPTAYAFNLAAGLTEPKLVLESDTAFSWGTKFDHWATGGKTWVQGFQLALPVIDGVEFQQYLTQQGITQIDRYLVSANAARAGVFVHPPQQGGQGSQQPLGRAEYGYQFDPQSYARLFASVVDTKRVARIEGAIADVRVADGAVQAVVLEDGREIAGDLFVDATGPEAQILSAIAGPCEGSRRLAATLSREAAARLGPAVREVSPAKEGWTSRTPIRGATVRLAVGNAGSPDFPGGGDASAEASIGYREQPWQGNCVAVGQAGGVIEPLTPAPVMLLQRDIERLLSLIPVRPDMHVEARQYNRRFVDDHEHAGLFTRALFETGGQASSPYWQDARADALPEKLARKIALFEERGVLVSYDLEPFHPEDWLILHFGMGRKPARYDIAADRAQKDKVLAYLSNLKREVERTVAELPPHAEYMAQLTQYLARNPA